MSNDKSQDVKAAESKAADPKPAELKANELALRDEQGDAIGVTVRLEPAENADHVSEHVTGWSTLKVDGEAYTFSKARARELFTRFPHFAEQVRKAVGDKGK